MPARVPHQALVYRPDQNRWLAFARPREVLIAERRDQVKDVVEQAAAQAARGRWCVGFLTYESASGFDPDLACHDSAGEPYAWWAVFDTAREVDVESILRRSTRPPFGNLEWRPRIDEANHAESVRRIKHAIARGDTYQVNLTFPLEAPFTGDPMRLFLRLVRAQRPPYATYIDTGRFAICSASPELFFTRRGRHLLARPMKGTARRGRFLAEDLAAIRDLRSSAKERAENVMIVDMMRNDLGRLAIPGSVTVPHLFTVETYATVHQLTSTVEAESEASLPEVLGTLFPCASITGAPKVSTMNIIRRLEPYARGVYTGGIGVLEPGGDARFSVAIRTVTVDREARIARYGTGGGIVWDSEPAREYEECRTKALILTASRPRFDLFETLLWRPRTGYWLLDRHLDRLAESARYFARPFDRATVLAALERAALSFGGSTPDPSIKLASPRVARRRVRLRLDARGRPEIESSPLADGPRPTWTVALDDRPVDASDPFLFHKTTHRARYDDAIARRPDVDEVLLSNRQGELTEGCRSNLVLGIDGRFVTPERPSGLLAGTLRGALIDRGRIATGRLSRADLERADSIFLINSLRGIVPARFMT